MDQIISPIDGSIQEQLRALNVLLFLVWITVLVK